MNVPTVHCVVGNMLHAAAVWCKSLLGRARYELSVKWRSFAKPRSRVDMLALVLCMSAFTWEKGVKFPPRLGKITFTMALRCHALMAATVLWNVQKCIHYWLKLACLPHIYYVAVAPGVCAALCVCLSVRSSVVVPCLCYESVVSVCLKRTARGSYWYKYSWISTISIQARLVIVVRNRN